MDKKTKEQRREDGIAKRKRIALGKQLAEPGIQNLIWSLMARAMPWWKAGCHQSRTVASLTAEEFFQEVCVMVLKQAPKYDRARGSLSTWLMLMVKRVKSVQLAAFNSQKRTANVSSLSCKEDDTTFQPHALTVDPWERVEVSEEVEHLEHCLDAMDPELVKYLKGHHYNGWTFGHLAEVYGLSKAWAQLGRYTPALAQLRELMGVGN